MSNDTKYPLSSKATRLKIELGKRYRRRDGKVTGNIQFTQLFPYLDPDNDNTYDANGRMSDENPEDLIEEYVEPEVVEVWAVVIPHTGIVVYTSPEPISEDDYYRTSERYKIIKLKEVTDEN